jgi:hypothetical protein
MVLEKAMAKRAMIRNTGKTVLQLPKKGHPASHCPNKEKNDNEKDNDNKSTAASLKKISKEIKGMKKQFTTIRAKLESHKEETDLSESEDNDEEGTQVL